MKALWRTTKKCENKDLSFYFYFKYNFLNKIFIFIINFYFNTTFRNAQGRKG